MLRRIVLAAAVPVTASLHFNSTSADVSKNSQKKVGSYIDHTVLKPTCLLSDVVKVCKEAKQHSFAAVCIPPNFVHLAKQSTTKSDVKVCTVIGFPFGYSNTNAKHAEIVTALTDGADELDIVANISDIKSGNWDAVATEISKLMVPIREAGKVVKVIIESGVLTDDEIIKCCEIYGRAGIDFLKTSTGYAESGASVHAVELFRRHLPLTMEIKASGGIRDYAAAKKMIDAGASRIGCSAGVAIVSGASTRNEYAKGAVVSKSGSTGGY